MRIPALILAVTLALTPALADVIRLKNGRTIYAERVRDTGSKIEYEIGDNTFAISKASVERVDGGGMAPPRREEIPVEPSQPVKHAQEMAGKIIRDGKVDLEALAAAEQQGDPEVSAAAYFAAGKHEQRHGNPEKARMYLQRALGFVPESGVMLEHFVTVLLEMHRYADAVPYAQQATRIAPHSPDAFALLGYALFYSERTKEAIQAWKRSLAMRPDKDVEFLLSKAERESAAEGDYGELQTGHFTVRYEGKASPASLRREIVDTLEAHFGELVRAFGHSPRQNIMVSLYTEQAFFDVTQAQGWSAAQNDGKLRIPIEGLNGMTGELSRVLKHELAHSFISQITRNRAPAWLHEGIAQLVEGQSSAGHGRLLARLFNQQKNIPLAMLEGTFAGFDTEMAMVAYAEALGAAEYVERTYGMSDLVRILQRIGEGASTEAALRAVVKSGYKDFEQDVGRYLKQTYGE